MAIFHRTLRLLPVALGLAALAVAILSQASVFQVQDDAYMYARYAENLRHGDGLAWNPGGEPTYGATALLYVPWVAAVATFFPNDPGHTIVMASLIAMLVALGGIALLVARSIPSNAPDNWLVAGVCVTLVALSHREIAAHATNGMDTGFAMAALALLLAAWWHCMPPRDEAGGAPPAPSATSIAMVVFTGWLAFLARPDLGLYSLGIPLVIAVLAPGGRRLEYAKIFAASLVLVAASLAWGWWYFGLPLPLSFYIKSLATTFGSPFLERHEPEAQEKFVSFLLCYAPLWILATLDLPGRWKARVQPLNAVWLAVFAATFLYWMYYRFGVLQVVAFHQRFYYPTLPALFLLGATSLSRLLSMWPARVRNSRLTKVAVGVCILACTLVCARALVSSARMLRSESLNRRLARFDLEGRYEIRGARTNWFALDGFSRLPDDLVLATTEVGLVAAMNPKKQVIDLVGLNDNGFVRHGFDAHRLCAQLRPDVLYMPHPDYTTMIEQIVNDAAFQSNYVHFTDKELGAYMGLALRHDSPYFAKMQELVAARRAEEASRGKPREGNPPK